MFTHYFRAAWRNLRKNKIYTAINIGGLSIGIAAGIIILLFVAYEKSFDDFQPDNIYRISEVQKFPGMISSQKVALSMFPMGPTMKAEFPEIKNFTRVSWQHKYPLTYNLKKVYFPQMLFVDSTFLEMFNFKMLEGDWKTALQKPNSVLLTQSSAEKLFGKSQAIGKTVIHYGEDTTTFVVTGVLENVPQQSQIQFDGLLSFNTIYQPDWLNNWGSNWLNTYLQVAPHTDIARLEDRFDAYLERHMSGGDQWKQYQLFLSPFKAIHANTADIGLDYINYQKFDNGYTNIFFIIACIVLLIACINFMNLSTARSSERAKEVGVRKSIGASKRQLCIQYIAESVLLTLLATAIAVIIIKLSLPVVNNLIQRKLQFPLFTSIWAAPFLLAGALFIGILSGLYPAIYLSSFKPVKVLKGQLQNGKTKGALRNILVVTQFSSAIFLVTATFFVVRQVNFMRKSDPGFNTDQVVNISLDATTYRKYDLLKQLFLKGSMITGVTAAQDVLGSHLDQSGVTFKGKGPERSLAGTRLIVDPDYLSLYGIKLLYGHNFSTDPSANGKEYILNESMAKELLKDEPKGTTMQSLIGDSFGFDSLGKIVGIANNFNFNSMQYKVETLYMFNQKDWGYSNISVKISGHNTEQALAYLRSTWENVFPDHPFQYEFLDDHFKEVYRADRQVGTIVGALATLAILISCLGLFGLATHAAEKRVKEIGIRKVLGASAKSIVAMLSIDFLKFVLLAALIALPIAWLSVHQWLQSYAFRIALSWWIFILVILLVMTISLMTISFQAIKAARANPIKSLKTE
ncbi:ABC transporter permease [Arachidicoccus terrestris]|uniref:ABC transporter permease n=1 Tax=Arachidicoccus terrestris TaxID=2875539 RepID=UPI001CC577AB|nr:ABC transporter permease [Arachidicoccus terrestris]UAY55657.1 ABC transporter permease [Arachidicoccus terrestris]